MIVVLFRSLVISFLWNYQLELISMAREDLPSLA
jgi:hypothetical protein